MQIRGGKRREMLLAAVQNFIPFAVFASPFFLLFLWWRHQLTGWRRRRRRRRRKKEQLSIEFLVSNPSSSLLFSWICWCRLLLSSSLLPYLPPSPSDSLSPPPFVPTYIHSRESSCVCLCEALAVGGRVLPKWRQNDDRMLFLTTVRIVLIHWFC